jgi:dimethylhistidine N-methyltransferase
MLIRQSASRAMGAGDAGAIEFTVDTRDLPDSATERRLLADGLVAERASISPRYFYDAVGCALFAAICELPEYYPTRTEAAIFERHRREIVAAIGTGRQLVDLGAGDCRKAEAWMAALAPRRYVAVDVAATELERALERVASAHPATAVAGIVTDFVRSLDAERGLDLGLGVDDGPTTFFYPGSSIGNFLPDDAVGFLRAIRGHCDVPGSGLLIGVDTVKDAGRLRDAYDDAAGVTAAFNRNILNHVNRVLATHFDPAAFDHVARYDTAHDRIEMHLEACEVQTVSVEGVERRFESGERILTEYSYKYRPATFIAMLTRAGFATVRCWQDERGDFAVYFAGAG